jgi:hypothetical protein
MITKRIFDPVYRQEILFINDCSYKRANKILQRNGFLPMESGPDIDGMFGKTDKSHNKDVQITGTVYFVYIKKKDGLFTLIHEISHLVISIFQDRGVEVGEDNTEPFAYYQEFWFRKLWELMAEQV